MWYVYVLRSTKNQVFYIGFTADLKRRFAEHNSGQFKNTFTYKNAPFKLVYYECYLHKKDAESAEHFYKTGYGREILKGKLKNFLKS